MTKLQRLLQNKDIKKLAEVLHYSVRSLQRWKKGDCEPYHPTVKEEVIRILGGKNGNRNR